MLAKVFLTSLVAVLVETPDTFLLDPKISHVRDVKIGVFSDIHLKMDYDPYTSEELCRDKSYSVFEDAKRSIDQNRPNENAVSKGGGFLSSLMELFRRGARAELPAFLGRKGCDSPQVLVEK